MKTETKATPTDPVLAPVSLLGVRQWAFEKAFQFNSDTDQAVDTIYRAAEIEAYITKGKNPRGDFFSCVDTALAEVDHASIPEVSDASKRKTMVVVRKWLKEYEALD